ncbi:MAG TPA: exodeoxyribonuclease VII large subunit [Acidimicrobiales bacterium]|nr:exodeoxyribonuclease VII large subunit [Acidimicrobiales bacterium]
MVNVSVRDEPVLEVGEFYELLTTHLESSFGRRRPHWVRGEIAKVYEKGHVYVDLVDAGSASSDTKRPVLNAHCWATPWAVLKRRLGAEGVTLKVGMVVSFLGYVDVYAPQGKIGFSITEIDVEGLLGDVARRRLELIARLREEGLMDLNKAARLSPVPLRVGLVASPGTEGFQDFTGQLLNSGFSFEIVLVRTLVQGDAAPAQIVRAVMNLNEHGVDVICVVRGGGSRGDLACFDDEGVARAIATSRAPVFTGIGHTGDESVADLVAHTHSITPTKLGEEIVGIVNVWYEENLRHPAQRLLDASNDVLDEAEDYLGERRRTMIFAVRDRLRAEERHLVGTRERLVIQGRHLVASATQLLAGHRQLLAAYDPTRRLAQGWSIVTDARGAVVKSLRDVTLGDEVHVLVSDGSFTSQVTDMKGTPS